MLDHTIHNNSYQISLILIIKWNLDNQTAYTFRKATTTFHVVLNQSPFPTLHKVHNREYQEMILSNCNRNTLKYVIVNNLAAFWLFLLCSMSTRF